jgi:hypothetical protein
MVASHQPKVAREITDGRVAASRSCSGNHGWSRRTNPTAAGTSRMVASQQAEVARQGPWSRRGKPKLLVKGRGRVAPTQRCSGNHGWSRRGKPKLLGESRMVASRQAEVARDITDGRVVKWLGRLVVRWCASDSTATAKPNCIASSKCLGFKADVLVTGLAHFGLPTCRQLELRGSVAGSVSRASMGKSLRSLLFRRPRHSQSLEESS